MNCKDMNELLSLYIDNELSDTERKGFEDHLEACEACRHEVEEISQLVHACCEIEEAELPEGFKQELHMKTACCGSKERFR